MFRDAAPTESPNQLPPRRLEESDMALIPRLFFVRIERTTEAFVGDTMNEIRSWLDHRKSNRPRSGRSLLMAAAQGLRSASTVRMRRIFSRWILADLSINQTLADR